MLGDAEAVVDRRVGAGGVEPGGRAELLGGHAGDGLDRLRGVLRLADELLPGSERHGVAAVSHEGAVDQAFGGDHVAHGIDDGDVGAGLQLQVVVGLDVRRAHEVDAARIGHDEAGALPQAALHARAEDRMRVRGVRTDDHDDVSLGHGLEVLGAC